MTAVVPLTLPHVVVLLFLITQLFSVSGAETLYRFQDGNYIIESALL